MSDAPTHQPTPTPTPASVTVKRLDGGSLRALAHPLRVRILGLLRSRGPATATILGERLGESSGATSYHLRVLAEHGFVVDEPTRNRGRERWWRAAQDMTSWQPEQFLDDPDEQAAEQWLSGFHSRETMKWLDDWLAQRPSYDPTWVAVADQSDYRLVMSPDQVRAMLDELHEVIGRYVDAAGGARPDPAALPADARPLRLLLFAFPRDDEGAR
jgi:DNA-binding transcriptional ArsR family regulator